MPIDPTENRIYIITRLLTKLKVMGQDTPVSQPDDGIIGFMVVIDDYQKALKWVNGDMSRIIIGKYADHER